MIETGAGKCVYKNEVEKKKLTDSFSFFIYLFSFVRLGKYPPVVIHEEVFNDLYHFHKVETI